MNLTQEKILILGAQGMLGQDLAQALNDLDIIAWDQADLDITDQGAVNNQISKLKPKIIINTAAYTAVDDCETNQELALQVNGEAVGYLAQAAKDNQAVLLHISTDYIFNGLNINGYNEDSQEFGPQSVYGQSKLKGEERLKQINPNYYLIRTSWLYGKNGKNFVETIKRLGQEKDQLKVINDQFGKPTFTVDLAKQIRYILDNNLDFGTYHITNQTAEGGISWYDFARKIMKLSGLQTKVNPCSTAEYPRPAKRPQYSALNNTKLPQSPDWEEALSRYLANG